MMKTALILLLSLALTAAALATRPGKREFMLFLLDSHTPADGSWSQADLSRAEDLAKGVTVRDRYLWSSVEKDGKVLYVGAFAHWFASDAVESKKAPSLRELAHIVRR